MNIPFTKMHGLGNNYIYIDRVSNPGILADWSVLAEKISNVSTGIGSDGLILIEKGEEAELRMRIFNKDGSEGQNCGNGLRCVARYAYDHGLVDKTEMTIETRSGLVTAYINKKGSGVSTVTVNMGAPVIEAEKVPVLIDTNKKNMINEPFSVGSFDGKMTAVSMGNPHAIFFMDEIDQNQLEIVGKIIADGAHQAFPEGVNVGFVEVKDRSTIRYRVWERGSGMTQACGTGACAAAVSAILNRYVDENRPVVVTLDGGDLEISWQGGGSRVMMTGAAEYICKGYYFLD